MENPQEMQVLSANGGHAAVEDSRTEGRTSGRTDGRTDGRTARNGRPLLHASLSLETDLPEEEEDGEVKAFTDFVAISPRRQRIIVG